MEDSALSNRVFIWKRTFPMLEDTWVIGKGHGVYAATFPQDGVKELTQQNVYVDRPHNLYLQMAHASGNLSAILYIAALGWFFFRAWRKRTDGKLLAVMAAMVGYSVACLVDDPGVGVAPVAWVIWGAGFALLEDA